MRVIQGCLLGTAIFQILSMLLGVVELLATPQRSTPLLGDMVFAGRYVLATLLLGVTAGGFQWAAVIAHLWMRRWLPLGYTLAGTVTTGWIAGECLVLDNFIWPYALWDGTRVVQLLLVLALLGILRPGGAEVG